jgi:AraC-like DNA-binding protein
VGVEYVSRVPRPPLDGLIDDLYYLEGAPPYARLTLPPMPAALLIVNLGAPFRIRAGTDIETAEYADGCVVTMPTRALEFGYPLRTRSVGVHFKPWGLAPLLPMPAAELCDRPVTVEQVWGRPAIAELRDRLATADGPHEMLTLLEEELLRRLCETAGLGLVRRTSSVIAATSGAVAIGDLRVAAGVSSTHLAQQFKELIGVTPKRLARTCRFAVTVFRDQPRRTDRLGRPRRRRRLLRAGPLRPRVPGVHRAHADPVRRSPAAVPARTSRPRAGRLAAAGRLISYKSRQLTTR